VHQANFRAVDLLAEGFAAKLNSEIAKVLAAPDVVQRLFALGIDMIGGTPQQYAESIRADMQSYAKLVKDARQRVD